MKNFAREARNWAMLSLVALTIFWLATLGAGRGQTQAGAGQSAAGHAHAARQIG